MASVPVESAAPKMYCGECGGAFAIQDMARFGNQFVCANCKPGYVQRMREGVQPVGTTMANVRYGGFWMRALALLLDGLIVGVVIVPVALAIGFALGASGGFDPQNPPVGKILLFELFVFVLAIVYQVWFVTRKGGTPGKLILGLKIVTPDGQKLTTGRAVGRAFAYMLSGFVLYIGYIIAAFDSEKRALHDHICNTRVIYSK